MTPLLLQPVRRPRQRRKKEPRPATPILIIGALKAGAQLLLGFDQPVSLRGTPAFTTNIPGAVPISASQAGENSVMIAFSASVESATAINLTYRDPAIRNTSGGYVTSNRFPF